MTFEIVHICRPCNYTNPNETTCNVNTTYGCTWDGNACVSNTMVSGCTPYTQQETLQNLTSLCSRGDHTAGATDGHSCPNQSFDTIPSMQTPCDNIPETDTCKVAHHTVAFPLKHISPVRNAISVTINCWPGYCCPGADCNADASQVVDWLRGMVNKENFGTKNQAGASTLGAHNTTTNNISDHYSMRN